MLLHLDTDLDIGVIVTKVLDAPSSNIRYASLKLSMATCLESTASHLKMTVAHPLPQLICDRCKFLEAHLAQTIVIDDSPAINRTATDDITRGWFTVILAANTTSQISDRGKRSLDLLISR